MDTFFAIKIDQTHTYDKNGKRLFITRLNAQPLTVTQVKTQTSDKYSSLQFGLSQKRHINKPTRGHLKKLNLKPRYFKEARLTEDSEKQVGDSIKVDEVLSVGDFVKISSQSKGKGFAGGMKRWGFHGGPATHGQTDRQRSPGSIGQGTRIGRVFKGKKMAGHMGDVIVTRKGAQVINIDSENQTIWITGAVPGGRGALVKLEKYSHTEFVGLHTQLESQNKPVDQKESAEKLIETKEEIK